MVRRQFRGPPASVSARRRTGAGNSDRSRSLRVLLALAFVGAPVAAQRNEDVGRQMEREYGVVGTDTREGQRLNDQLDRVVERIVGGINSQGGDRQFRLKSARILGGRSE